MKSVLLRFVLASFSTLFLTTFAIPVRAADVGFFGVFKGRDFVQTNAGSADLISPDPFYFSASVDAADEGEVSGVSLELPNGTNIPMIQKELEESFTSEASLDAAFPSGTYKMIISGVTDGTTTNSLTVPSNAFPNAPRISNYNAAQAIDRQMDFTLTWDAFIGGTNSDFIELEIRDEMGEKIFASISPGEPGSLDGTATNIVIPAGTLQQGEQYRTRLTFIKVVTFDTSIYPGAVAVVAFVGETESYIETQSGPDVEWLLVVKSQSFNQTSASAPTPSTMHPYGFTSFIVESSSNSVASATLQLLPGGTAENFFRGGDGLVVEADFLSQAALDTAYPNGTYAVTMNTVNDGTKTNVISLIGDAYPSTPRISNYDLAQAVNPTNNFILTWDAFVGGTADDFVQVYLEDCQGNDFDSPGPLSPGALNGLSTSITLPAGALQSGRTYQG